MIRKSLITALILLAAYHLILPHLSRKFYQIGGPQRGNYARVQHYIYDVPSDANVILGSSMSLGLSEDILGPDYAKLTLPGCSNLTGLEIIRRSHKHPRLVLIESNQLALNVDQDIIQDSFNPWVGELRSLSPIFREEGRPANFASGITEAVVRKTCQLSSRFFEGKKTPTSNPTEPTGPELFRKLVQLHHEEFLNVPSAQDLSRNAATLARYVDELTASGSVCVFYEMPVDPSLRDLPIPATVRRIMEQQFPKTKFYWLSFPADENFETFDGVHITSAALPHFTKTFLTQINQLTGSTNSRSALTALRVRRDN